MPLRGNQRLKCFQCLNGSLEADSTGFESVLVGGLCDDRADEIVSQDVRPDLLPHEFWCLATQDVHLHGLLERPQVEFGVPAGAVEFRQITGQSPPRHPTTLKQRSCFGSGIRAAEFGHVFHGS